MRFTESKRRASFGLIGLVLVIVVGIALVLGLCSIKPTQKTIQKTIVFEAD